MGVRSRDQGAFRADSAAQLQFYRLRFDFDQIAELFAGPDGGPAQYVTRALQYRRSVGTVEHEIPVVTGQRPAAGSLVLRKFHTSRAAGSKADPIAVDGHLIRAPTVDIRWHCSSAGKLPWTSDFTSAAPH